MSNNTETTQAQTEVKTNKRAVAIAVFAATLPQFAEAREADAQGANFTVTDAKGLRTTVNNALMEQLEIKIGSAAGLYNHAKDNAEKLELVEPYGAQLRKPKAKPEAKTTEEGDGVVKPEDFEGMPKFDKPAKSEKEVLAELEDRIEEPKAWAIVNKQTGAVEGYADSRAKAKAAKTAEQTVKKTEELAQ